MRRRTSSDWLNTSKPATRAVPPLAGMKHERIFIVVDFPAPLGPRNPTILPFSTLKETSVDGGDRPVTLGEVIDLDHEWFPPRPAASIAHALAATR